MTSLSQPSPRQTHYDPNHHRNTAIPQQTAASALRMAYAIAGRHSGANAANRDDLASEALLALVECAQRFDPDRGHRLTSFAYPRMRGRALDSLRREARQVRNREAFSRSPHSKSFDTGPLSARADVERVLRDSREQLDSDERRLLTERYWQGKSLAEIARNRGWNEQKARRRHLTIIDKLRCVLRITVKR
jgi:RNA polymerase sigma factor (sigma-70 family)